jgi:hypothetical protein
LNPGRLQPSANASEEWTNLGRISADRVNSVGSVA